MASFYIEPHEVERTIDGLRGDAGVRMSALACSLLPGDEIPKPEYGPGVRLQDHMALMRCKSLPEVRLRAAAIGVDAEAWLRYEGACWRPEGWDFVIPCRTAP